jgi:hypothetical protein
VSANWWEAAPLAVEKPPKAANEDWWSDAPLAKAEPPARPLAVTPPPVSDVPPNYVPMIPQMPMIPGPFGGVIQAAQDAANAPPPPSWGDVMAQTPTQMRASSAQTIAGMGARSDAQALFLASRPEYGSPAWDEWVRQLEMAGEGGRSDLIMQMHRINTDPEERRRVENSIKEQMAIAAEAQADLDAAALPNRTLLQRGVSGAATSTPQAGAALVTGLATRNPYAAAASMYPMTAGQEFPGILSEIRGQQNARNTFNNVTLTPEELEQERAAAIGRSLFHSELRGTSAAATELLPFSQLLKPGASFLRRLIGDVVTDIPGESIDTLVGAIDEEIVKKPQGAATMEDVQRGLANGLAQLPETVVTTIMMGGTQAGVAHAPQAIENFVQGRRERAMLDEAAARKETPVADEAARTEAKREQQAREAREFTLRPVTPEDLDEIARRAEAAQAAPSFGTIVAPPISGSPAPEPGGAQAPTAPTATPTQGTASPPLSSALEPTEPPAPPSTSAPQEPAPAPAPAAPAVSTAQKPPEGGAGPTPESDDIAGKMLATLREDNAAPVVRYKSDPRGGVALVEGSKPPAWKTLPNKMQVREYVNVVNGERHPVQEIQLPGGKRYDRGFDYNGQPFDNIPLHLNEILNEGLARPGVAPSAAVPAAPAVSTAKPPAAPPAAKKPTKPAAPPSPQMTLFGTEGEPTPAATPAPAVAPAQAAPATAARPFDAERTALNEFIKAPKKFGQYEGEEKDDATAVKFAREALPKLDELESLLAQVPEEKLSPEFVSTLRSDIASIATAANPLSRQYAALGASVGLDRLIYEAKELAAGRTPEPTPRQEQLAQQAAKPAKPLNRGEVYEPVAKGQPTRRAASKPEEEEPGGGTTILPIEMPQDEFEQVLDEWAALFEDPQVKVRATDHPEYGEFLTPAEAEKRIDGWRDHAASQGEDRQANADKTIFSLFDLTGVWSQPYVDAGYNVIQIDLQTGHDIRDFSVEYITENWPDITDVYGILIAAPCTDFASSGARWFAKKDEDGRTEASKELVFQALRTVEYFRPQMWVLENPVGRIESLTGLPKARYSFDPNDFGDPYTKKTQLWGKFNTDLPVAPVEPTEGSKMHSKYGGGSLRTKNARSETPEGFAYAFFMANNFADAKPAERLLSQFPEAAGAIEKALAAGFTEAQIREVVTDPYENYEYPEARDAVRQLVKTGKPEGTPTAPAEPAPKPPKKKKQAKKAAEPAADEPMADEPLEDRRRPRPPPSKAQPGPYTQSREGELRASPHDEIWTESGLNATKMNLLPPPEQFKAAAEIVKKRFGFVTVKKAPNLTWGDAIDVMKDAFVGLTNHSAVFNMNPGEVSLNGRLQLLLLREFKQSPGTRAYFDPSTQTIGMIRRNDSFTHEWAHALDDMLLEKFAPELLQGRGQLLTGKIRSGGTPATMNAQVRDAFVGVVNAMFFDQAGTALYLMDLDKKIATAKTPAQKAQLQKQRDTFMAGHSKKIDIQSDYYKRAKEMEGGPSEGGYLQKPTEMFARAVEAYMGSKLAGYPADHPFVTKSDRMYNEQRVGEFPAVFPSGADRANIFAAIDTLMRALRDAGLVQSDNAPAALQPTDTQYWKKQAPYLTDETARKARGIISKLRDDARAQSAEMDRAYEASNRRKEHAKQTRAIRLDRAGREGLNRMTRDIGMSVVDQLNAVAAGLAHSIRGTLLSLNEKYPGNPGIPQLIRWFATDPGSGKLQGPVFMDEVRHRERTYQNRLADILEKHRVYKFTTEERMDLRDVIVNSIPSEAVAPNVAAAAEDLSKLTDDLYVYNVSNGVNIGYAKNGFLPRIVDEMAIEDDPEGFRTAARGLYSIVYDKEIGTLEEVLADRERVAHLLAQVGEIARNGRVPESKATAQQLVPLAERVRELMHEIEDAAEGTDTEALEEAFELAVGELVAAMRPVWAAEAANDWELRIRDIGARPEWEFEHRGIASKYTKQRTLPPETDTIMRDYLKNDAVELITTYISQAVRRVEFGRAFGNPESGKGLGWKLEDAMTAMKDPYRVGDGEHRISRDDREEIQQSVNILLGTYNTSITQRGLRWMNSLMAFWTPVILARSLKSQLAEPFTASIKMDTRAGFQVLGKQLQDLYGWAGGSVLDYLVNKTPDFKLFHDALQATFKGLGVTGARRQAEWRQAIGEFFGIVTNHLTDNIMATRYNVINQNTPDKLRLARFFRALGVHPHAMSMRRAIGEVFLTRYGPALAKKALGENKAVAKQAQKDLAELGIDSRNDALLRELAHLPDIKSVQELESLRFLDEIRTAVNRMTSQTSQEPGAIDKPRRASLPETSIFYAIMGFQAAFTRNILTGSAKRIVRSWQDDAKVGASVNASIAIGFGLLMAGQLAAWIAGVLAFDNDDWEEKKKKIDEQWLGQMMTRTGMFGMTDPIVNSFTGLKYQKDLATTMSGAVLAQPLSLGQAAGNLVAQNSPNTATAEYQITKQAWNNVITPWITSKALRFVGRNPLIDTAFGIGIPYLTSPKVSDPIAETVAETVTGQEYVSKKEKARAERGDAEATKAVERAKSQGKPTLQDKVNKRLGK